MCVCACVRVRACVRACVRVVHLYCSAQMTMLNMEKRYRNKIIIIIIINHYVDPIDFQTDLKQYQHQNKSYQGRC